MTVNAGPYRDQIICRKPNHVMIYVLATIDIYYLVYIYHTAAIYQEGKKVI